jgi:hypothetical protein
MKLEHVSSGGTTFMEHRCTTLLLHKCVYQPRQSQNLGGVIGGHYVDMVN